MKNASLGLLLFSLSIALLPAQAWNLVHPEYHNAYYETGGELVTAGIYVDRIRFDEITGEQIFHLNTVVRQVCDCGNLSNCTFLHNQEQFLGLSYRATENGWRTLRKDGSHRIFRYDRAVGESWTFNEGNTTTATVLTRGEQEILPGLMDSVMVFATSAADTFSWAKTHGIIEYRPAGEAVGHCLSGIKALEIGDSGLGFNQIFDFNIGDRFYYRNTFPGASSSRYTLLSVEILEKTVTDSSFVYDVHRLSYSYSINMIGPPEPSTYVDTFETITYLRSSYPQLESFPRELVLNAYSFADFGLDNLGDSVEVYQRSDLQIDEHGNEVRVVGGFDSRWEGGAFQVVDGQDELEPDYIFNAYQQFFAAGRGELSLATIILSDVEIHREQLGAIINGDTIGQVFADSILTVSTRELELVTLPLKVFPNPTKDWLQIQPPANLNRRDAQLIIHDGLGRPLMTYLLSENNRIDVSQLSTGWYSLSLTGGGKRYLARWLKQ